jgi:hypothetical protein
MLPSFLSARVAVISRVRLLRAMTRPSSMLAFPVSARAVITRRLINPRFRTDISHKRLPRDNSFFNWPSPSVGISNKCSRRNNPLLGQS